MGMNVVGLSGLKHPHIYASFRSKYDLYKLKQTQEYI